MTGERGNDGFCPLCGGRLKLGVATIPFVITDTVVVIKGVPAEICNSCHEPFVTGQATDRIMAVLSQLQTVNTEVSVVHYSEPSTKAA